MLCTAHRELDGDEWADTNGLYKRAYWNHPCTIWARESSSNYQWLYRNTSSHYPLSMSTGMVGHAFKF